MVRFVCAHCDLSATLLLEHDFNIHATHTHLAIPNVLTLCHVSSIYSLHLAVEYQSFPSGIWKPALFEASIVEELLQTQFHQYISRVKTTDCQAELKRLLAAGPPIFLQDKHALPLALEHDTHIGAVWFARDDREVSAKLHGAVEGEERDILWEELKQFVIVEGKEEGDDEADEEEDQN